MKLIPHAHKLILKGLEEKKLLLLLLFAVIITSLSRALFLFVPLFYSLTQLRQILMT